jgi:hypothetical protein
LAIVSGDFNGDGHDDLRVLVSNGMTSPLGVNIVQLSLPSAPDDNLGPLPSPPFVASAVITVSAEDTSAAPTRYATGSGELQSGIEYDPKGPPVGDSITIADLLGKDPEGKEFSEDMLADLGRASQLFFGIKFRPPKAGESGPGSSLEPDIRAEPSIQNSDEDSAIPDFDRWMKGVQPPRTASPKKRQEARREPLPDPALGTADVVFGDQAAQADDAWLVPELVARSDLIDQAPSELWFLLAAAGGAGVQLAGTSRDSEDDGQSSEESSRE